MFIDLSIFERIFQYHNHHVQYGDYNLNLLGILGVASTPF